MAHVTTQNAKQHHFATRASAHANNRGSNAWVLYTIYGLFRLEIISVMHSPGNCMSAQVSYTYMEAHTWRCICDVRSAALRD